jgi:PEP-CTERM motif
MRFPSKSLTCAAIACMALILFGSAPAVLASPVVLNITNANCGLSCGTVPANTVIGTVSLNLNGNGSITATIAINSNFTFIVPDGNDININGLGTNVSISAFNSSNTGAPGSYITPLSYSSLNTNTNVGSGLGTYAVTIFHMTDLYHPQQPLNFVQFTITTNGGYKAQDVQNVAMAFHLGNCPSPNNGCNATTTGFVGTGPGTVSTVPEPATGALATLGLSLLAAGVFMRRRFGVVAAS